MRIWRFSNPSDYRFARAGRRGTWTPPDQVGVCPECTSSRQERVKPLVIEWQPGSDVVGDFTWPGFDSEIVVKDFVMESLLSRFSGFEPGPVETVQDPKLRPTGRGKPRVWLPYSGPSLYEVWITTWAHIDAEISTVFLKNRCGTCGAMRYEVSGVERWDSKWSPETGTLQRRHRPREAGKGIFVREDDLCGDSIFHAYELPSWMFCTDPVRDFVVQSGFTNVTFLEMGETI